MNAFGRRGGGGGMRAAARFSPGGRKYGVRLREHPEGGWELIEDEEGPVLGNAESDLGGPGGRFGRQGTPEYSVIALPDGFVVHQYPEGHLHVVKSPNGPEDVWLYRDSESHDAWKELTAEVWEARRVKAEVKEAATVVKAVADVTKAVVKVVAPEAPRPAPPPPFPKPKPRVPALDAKPKRRLPWGLIAFFAAVGTVAVLGGGGKAAKHRSGGEEG